MGDAREAHVVVSCGQLAGVHVSGHTCPGGYTYLPVQCIGDIYDICGVLPGF